MLTITFYSTQIKMAERMYTVHTHSFFACQYCLILFYHTVSRNDTPQVFGLCLSRALFLYFPFYLCLFLSIPLYSWLLSVAVYYCIFLSMYVYVFPYLYIPAYCLLLYIPVYSYRCKSMSIFFHLFAYILVYSSIFSTIPVVSVFFLYILFKIRKIHRLQINI